MFELSKLVPNRGILAPSSPHDPGELERAARSALRAAQHERDQTQQAVAEAQAAVGRVQKLIDAAGEATARLDQAETASAAFTQSWVQHGARTGELSADPHLVEVAREAAAHSQAAKIAASGAQAGLPAASATLESARNDLAAADGRVGTAVARTLAAMLEPELAKAELSGAAFEQAAVEVLPVIRAIAGRWHSFSDDGVATALLARLRAAAPTPLPQQATDLLGRQGEPFTGDARQFVELGERLLSDPDAQ